MMPFTDHPTHALTAEMTVQELYIVLGYAWYHAAVSYGAVTAAHNRLAMACKVALREAGEPDQRIEDKLAGIMLEMGVQPSG
jgi:hypothetical protein